AQALALLAEPAGAPHNGQFPLRLRPLHRAQAAELYALLEAENAESAISAKPETPPPDTMAMPPPPFTQDSAPIARAMSGAPPTPLDLQRPSSYPFDPKKTAPSSAFSGPVSSQPKREEVRTWATTPRDRPVDDPRRTVPSAQWPKGAIPAERGTETHDASMNVSVVFDPDRVARTPAAAPAPLPADEEGGTLSVSVIFEPDSQSVVVDTNTTAP